MKKVIRITAVALLVVMLTLALAACGKTLSGEYAAEKLGTGVALEFDGNKVTATIKVATIKLGEVEGTYTIDGDKITLDFVDEDAAEDEDVKEYLAGINGEFDFEETEDGIKIDGVEYTKKD